MDVSQLFKRNLAEMHLVPVTKTVEDRKGDHLKVRRTKRDTLAFALRNIDIHLSPFQTPIKEPCPQQKPINKTEQKQVEKADNGCAKRLELLKKWKSQREERKKQEQLKKKPIFKVYHVSPDKSSSLENANRLIKGKPITNLTVKKSQFAPVNHKFKAPKGIKPLNFDIASKVKHTAKISFNFSSPRKQVKPLSAVGPLNSKSREKISLGTATSRPQRSTTLGKADTSQVQRKKNVEQTNKAPKKTSQLSKQPSKSQDQEAKGPQTRSKTVALKSLPNKSQTPNADGNIGRNGKLPNGRKQSSVKTSLPKVEPIKPDTKKEDSPVDLDKKCTPLKTSLENVKVPVYISPFVVISRGKDNARKEQKEKLHTPNKGQSPQAGADYFLRKLNFEVARLGELCEDWKTHLEDPELPEEARSSIDVTIGQSKLLISKKFEQFRGLIVQCKTQQYEEKVITCEDLHGFWDMIYMQVENLDQRFTNLNKLKANNWTEILPENKRPVRKAKVQAKKVTATSKLKDVLKAAREKQKALNQSEKVRTPLKEKQDPTTPNSTSKRRSFRVSVLTTESQKRCSSSPGLTMMKVSQSIKKNNGLTPAKSILKGERCKSTGKKSVAFKESLSPKNCRRAIVFIGEENEAVQGVEENKENRIQKRSARLSSR